MYLSIFTTKTVIIIIYNDDNSKRSWCENNAIKKKKKAVIRIWLLRDFGYLLPQHDGPLFTESFLIDDFSTFNHQVRGCFCVKRIFFFHSCTRVLSPESLSLVSGSPRHTYRWLYCRREQRQHPKQPQLQQQDQENNYYTLEIAPR